MGNVESPVASQTSLMYILLAVAAIIGGFYLFSDLSEEQAISLIYIYSGETGDALMEKIISSVKDLPVQLRLFTVVFALKGISYLKVFPLVIFGIITALIDAHVKKGLYRFSSPPSVTDYHMAKKMMPVCFFHLPLIYMSAPIEGLIKIDAETIKYIVVSINAVLLHHFMYTLSVNKPPKI
jgi:hypothetical protein